MTRYGSDKPDTRFGFELHDCGLIEATEPFENLLTQGMVIKDGKKMSKSIGNIVTPLDIIDKYGADTARLFILFAAPPDRELDWSDAGVEGSYRFINRVYRLVYDFVEKYGSGSSSYTVKDAHGKDRSNACEARHMYKESFLCCCRKEEF